MRPLGITVQSKAAEDAFFATAFARPFGDDAASWADARSDAQLGARLLLKKDPRVPRAENGKLLGVIDVGECVGDGRAYATVSVDTGTVAKARQLNDALRQSLARQPAPGISSFSWVDNGMPNSTRPSVGLDK